MSQRTFTLTGNSSDFGNGAVAGAPCSFQPLVPGGTQAVDGAGSVVSTKPVAFTTDDLGNLVAPDGISPVTIDYPGDFEAAYANTQVRVVLDGEVIDSPVGFSYASSIDLSAWIAAPTTAGKVRMRLVYTLDDGTPVAGARLSVAVTQPAVVVASGVLLASANPSVAVSAGDGTFEIYLDPNALLNPTGLGYTATVTNSDGGAEPTVWTFTVPTVVDVYQGAWNGAATYHQASGAGNGDVVLSGGVLYRCILTHTNHAPPNGTYWAVVAGLPTDLITEHLVPAAPAGVFAAMLANILFPLVVLTAGAAVTAATPFVLIDATSNDVTATLPDAGTVSTPIWVKRIDASVHAGGLASVSAQTFDGAASPYLLSPGTGLMLIANGGNWQVF